MEDWEVLDLLSHLVAKSLVVVEPPEDGQVRYRLLENLRQYARERLAETDEAAALAAASPRLVPGASPKRPSRTCPGRSRRHGWTGWNATMTTCARPWTCAATRRAGPRPVRLAGALWRFWHVRGYLSEGRQWSEAALARADDAPPAVRAQALGGAGILAWAQQDYPAAQRLCEASLGLWLSLDNKSRRRRP